MTIIWTILLSVATLFLTFYLYFKRTFTYWKNKGFPYAEPELFWGNIKGINFTKSPSEILTDIYYQFPKERFVGVWIFNKPALIVRDPELAKLMLVRDFMTFHDRGIPVNEELDPLSAHLIFLGGSKWRNLRVKLSPTFTSGKMKLMFPIMTQCSRQFSQVLEKYAKDRQVIDVKDYAARFTTDVISSAAFGLETNSLSNPESEFRKFGQEIFTSNWKKTINLLIISRFPKIASALSLKSLSKETEDFFMNSLRQTIAYRKESGVQRNDFLDSLIQLMSKGYIEGADSKNADSKANTKFTFEEAAAQSFVFFLAGFETSSTTMQFALYELSKSPDIQKRTRDEIKDVLAKHNGEITYESVTEMSYLSRVIDETLRLYPPVAVLQRESNKDYKIPDSDLVLPKDTTVMIPAMGFQNDPEYYPDPEKFNPDRFLDEEKSRRHNSTYLPFGDGPRNCIGMRFGLLQTKVGLISLLNQYEFSVAPETKIPLIFDPAGLVLAPLGGMNLRISEFKS